MAYLANKRRQFLQDLTLACTTARYRASLFEDQLRHLLVSLTRVTPSRQWVPALGNIIKLTVKYLDN